MNEETALVETVKAPDTPLAWEELDATRELKPYRRGWTMTAGIAGSAVIAAVGLAAWILQSPPHASVQKPSSPPPLPSAAAPSIGPVLDGTYEVDADSSQITVNGVPQPTTENPTEWVAFRSVCTPSVGCVATARALNDNDHRRGIGKGAVYRFRQGLWVEDPHILTIGCPGNSVHSYPVSQTVALTPRANGTLQAITTQTITTDAACANHSGMKGTVIQFPSVLTRSGDTPPGIVADPASVS